jgi:hypothetical protein
MKVNHYQGPLPQFRGYVSFCSCCSPNQKRKIDPESNDEKQSRKPTLRSKKPFPSSVSVSTVKSGNRSAVTTKSPDAISLTGTTPPTVMTAAGNVTSISKASASNSCLNGIHARPSDQRGYRAKDVRGYDQCYKCGVYCVHRSGLCQSCR